MASRPQSTAAVSADVGDSVSNWPRPHVGQSGFGVASLILRHSFCQTSNCISEPCNLAKLLVSSLSASVTWAAETMLMIGMITPAVSQVGALAEGGASSNTQRKQGVWCGRIVIVTPYEPTAAPKIQLVLSFTQASLMR